MFLIAWLPALVSSGKVSRSIRSCGPSSKREWYLWELQLALKFRDNIVCISMLAQINLKCISGNTPPELSDGCVDPDRFIPPRSVYPHSVPSFHAFELQQLERFTDVRSTSPMGLSQQLRRNQINQRKCFGDEVLTVVLYISVRRNNEMQPVVFRSPSVLYLQYNSPKFF